MDNNRKSGGSPEEVGRIPTVTETERIRNGQSKTGATPRPDRKNLSRTTPTASLSARSEKSAPNFDLIALRCFHLGPAKVREACQLAWKWHKRGIGPNASLALIDLYIERAGKIGNAFKLFNPGSSHFPDLCESAASRLSEAEGAALKKAEGIDAARNAERMKRAAQDKDRWREPEATP